MQIYLGSVNFTITLAKLCLPYEVCPILLQKWSIELFIYDLFMNIFHFSYITIDVVLFDFNNDYYSKCIKYKMVNVFSTLLQENVLIFALLWRQNLFHPKGLSVSRATPSY